MITADKLALLINMPSVMLTTAIQEAGYKKDSFTGAKFVGITNGGQFCYFVTYVEDGNICNTKVFLTYDPTADRVSASY
jgi:hypothetical protein